MIQKELSVIAEIGLGIAMSINENYFGRDLLLQYYAEEQLEWLARSEVPESELNASTMESVLADRKDFIDILIGKKTFDWVQYKKDVYERTGVLLS